MCVECVLHSTLEIHGGQLGLSLEELTCILGSLEENIGRAECDDTCHEARRG